MKRRNFNLLISILLLASLSLTGLLGYIQSRLEIRQFVPHRYFAYATLALAALHVFLNWRKIWAFFRRKG